MLEGIEEGINHQTTGFGLQAILLFLSHISLRSTIYISQENLGSTNRLPLKFLVV